MSRCEERESARRGRPPASCRRHWREAVRVQLAAAVASPSSRAAVEPEATAIARSRESERRDGVVREELPLLFPGLATGAIVIAARASH
ncbi:uncharacterized protein DS421_1g18460 [Arachis hypogaea]|nr:uncharacterized protein DS421_1g18460 [Arachis hypogaea]